MVKVDSKARRFQQVLARNPEIGEEATFWIFEVLAHLEA